MIVREARHRPLAWAERRKQVPAWAVSFFAVEWVLEWLAYLLSRWHLVTVVDYLGTLSILAAVFFYFHDADNRVMQRHYQAWQVINTAQGKGGSGGRVEALQELNADGVALIGVDVSTAFLQGVHLRNARLVRSNFSAADVRNADFSDADLEDSDLHSANFRQSSFKKASLGGSRLDDADLEGADLTDADLSGAILDNADLRFVNLSNTGWNQIRSIQGANLFGLKDSPSGFLEWAVKHGAVQFETDEQWEQSRKPLR